jgi:Ca2+-binding RTX toxin-like protein
VTGDSITLNDMLDVADAGVQRVQFADGTTLSAADLINEETTGTDGSDDLVGSTRADVLDGKGGDDLAIGNGGNDTFVFKEGYGELQIQENDSSLSAENVLSLGSGITSDSLIVNVSSDGSSLILTDGFAGDQIVLDNILSSKSAGVQAVQFADGSVITRQQLINMAYEVNGTTGADTLYGTYNDVTGTDNNETFDGKGGGDVEYGGGGSDTFIFDAGYGYLEIYQTDEEPIDENVLQLGAGITESSLTVTVSEDRNSLIISDGIAGDQITIDEMVGGYDSGIQQILLADGTRLSTAQIYQLEMRGTSGADTLVGTNAADLLDGKGGGDVEVGNGGGDTFVFDRGYGALEIDEFDSEVAPRNVLELGEGIVMSTLHVAASADRSSIVLTDGVAGDQITIDGALDASFDGVQVVQFADGQSWTAQQLVQMELEATVGADTLVGSTEGNFFDGQGGGDVEVGNGGNDTFVFNEGYGSLEIDELDYGAAPENVLQLGAGITQSSISLAISSDHKSLMISDGVDGDQITLDNVFSNQYAGVQQVDFADGSTLSATQLLQMVQGSGSGANYIFGTSGSDELSGTAEADVFDGLGGDDFEQGGGGHDTFEFNAGYGDLEIYEVAAGAGNQGVLQLGAGISESAITATVDRSGNIIVNDGITGDQITIDGMGVSITPNGTGIDAIKFSDGVSWTAQQLETLAHAVVGTTGDDSLSSAASGMSYDGRGGNDIEVGEGGNDTFIFNQGYGNLEVSEFDLNSSDVNVLHFGPGISAASISVASIDGETIVVTDGRAGDQVTLDSMLANSEYGVQQFTFDDGSSLTRSQILQLATTGTTGSDTLYGSSGADFFDGKGGNDIEFGGGGSDTFVFEQGYGSLEIDEESSSPDEPVLLFAAGLSSSSLSVALGSDGSSLVLTDGTAGDAVTIDYMALGAGWGVGSVQFADGTSMSAQQLLALLTIGTTGSDNLVGTGGAELFDGKGGADIETGNGGSDTFVYNRGYGPLEINEDYLEPDVPVLRLGGGITSASLHVSATADGTGLVLTDGAAGDEITLDNMLSQSEWGVQEVEFSDGSTLSASELFQMETTGTSGNDTLYGSAGPNVFDGRGGNDLEIGDGGSDTFVFGKGYGDLEVDEAGPSGSPTDVLKLGAGITEASMAASVVGDDLVVTDGTAGDAIQIDDMGDSSWTSNSGYGIEQIEFADGTIWTAQQLLVLAHTIEGTSGPDTLNGTSTADLFDGRGGNDLAIGAGGDDTFVFDEGYGLLEIDETDSLKKDVNVLQFGAGVSAASLIVTSDSSGDIFLTDGLSGDRVELDEMQSVSTYGIQLVQFVGGATLTRSQLMTLATTGTAGADTLYGTSGADLFDGKGGKDKETGDGGNDTFVFDQGYASLDIDEIDTSSKRNNVLQMGSGISATSLAVTSDSSGNLYISDGVSGDQVKLEDMQSVATDGIQILRFADGTTLTRAQLLQLATTGTSAADTLYGTTGADLFDGKGGKDKETGDGGNDTFVFNEGYGKLEIDEIDTSSKRNNLLKMGPGITAASLAATSDSAGNIFISDGIAGDQVELDDMQSIATDGIETLQFADGTTLSRAQILQLATTGTSGADTLYGTSGADLFDGKGGKDKETGDGGNDTFVFDQGYGSLEVVEIDASAKRNNVLQLGAGITASSIVVTSDSSGDILISDGVAGDQVKLDSMQSTASSGVQQVQFADGTTLSLSQLLGMATTGSVGSDTLYGTSSADVFDGHGGTDTEHGNGGSDTYTLAPGYGALTVVNGISGTNKAAGELLIENENPADLWLRQVGNNLEVDVMGTSTKTTVQGWFSNNYSKLSSIDVAGGSAGSLILDTQINQLIQAMATYATSHAGFDPTAAINSQITDPTVLSAVASAWHS